MNRGGVEGVLCAGRGVAGIDLEVASAPRDFSNVRPPTSEPKIRSSSVRNPARTDPRAGSSAGARGRKAR